MEEGREGARRAPRDEERGQMGRGEGEQWRGGTIAEGIWKGEGGREGWRVCGERSSWSGLHER